MRNLYELNRYRRTDRHVMEMWGWAGDGTADMFMIPSPIEIVISPETLLLGRGLLILFAFWPIGVACTTRSGLSAIVGFAVGVGLVFSGIVPWWIWAVYSDG